MGRGYRTSAGTTSRTTQKPHLPYSGKGRQTPFPLRTYPTPHSHWQVIWIYLALERRCSRVGSASVRPSASCPFEWEQAAGFAKAYGVRHQGYCHPLVAMMTVGMFGGICMYDDAPRLVWRNVRFEADGSEFRRFFDKRRNTQHRQGKKVLVAASPLAVVCSVGWMWELQVYTGVSEDIHVFRGFNGRMVAKSPSTLPRDLSGLSTKNTSDFRACGSMELWEYV